MPKYSISVFALTSGLFLTISQFSMAAEPISAQPGKSETGPSEQLPATQVIEVSPASADEIEAKSRGCYTSSKSCSGIARFWNDGPGGIGCTIWKNNGAAGRVNFTLRNGESTNYNVIYNDTYNCVAMHLAPPDTNLKRWYIFVE